MSEKVNLAAKFALLEKPFEPAVVGHLTIHLRDRDVELDPGELFVVPRGVEHCPEATEDTEVLLIEPDGTVNTGDAGGELTAEPRVL